MIGAPEANGPLTTFPLMVGRAAVTVNVWSVLLCTPFTVTATDTVPVTPAGTVVVIELLLQLPLLTVAAVVPNITALVPCDAPKFDPAITTVSPTAPEGGVRLAMTGAAALILKVKLLDVPAEFVTVMVAELAVAIRLEPIVASTSVALLS
jgi:hypothetical protein